jgi:hypothetical protein
VPRTGAEREEPGSRSREIRSEKLIGQGQGEYPKGSEAKVRNKNKFK